MNYKATYYRIILKDNREIVVTDVMSISVILMIEQRIIQLADPTAHPPRLRGFT